MTENHYSNDKYYEKSKTPPHLHLEGESLIRKAKLDNYQSQGKKGFAYSFDRSDTLISLRHNYDSYSQTELEEESIECQLSGRLHALRDHGKASFLDIHDESSQLQLYIKESNLDPDSLITLENLDIGDFIGVSGVLFKTKKDVLSLRITKLLLLTKALRPLPEKYHGLRDKELRYRKRYLDLIANVSVRNIFQERSNIIHFIRNYLHNCKFMEVETPVLQSIYGGASAQPFTTHHNELKQDLYLRVSLELPLKRLLVGGFERVYEIGRVFRNEGISYKHNPEYTLLELYQAYADYQDMMKLTENLLSNLILQIKGCPLLDYQGKSIDFSPPFDRLSFQEAFKKFLGCDINDVTSLRQHASKLIPDADAVPHATLITTLYDKHIEPMLIKPTFITDHPIHTSPLAKKHREIDAYVERFELIANGMELANAFSELNDPMDQYERFLEQQENKKLGDSEYQPMDRDFIEALEYGMPPAGGVGIGIDRIVMLLTNSSSIRDVIFFPHMKSIH